MDLTLRRSVASLGAARDYPWQSLGQSRVENVLSRAIAMPASRFLRMKRSVSLLVADRDRSGQGKIIEGTYQSPILVQWHRGARRSRVLDVTVTRFI